LLLVLYRGVNIIGYIFILMRSSFYYLIIYFISKYLNNHLQYAKLKNGSNTLSILLKFGKFF
jgi:hypothetical protein